MPAPNSPDLTGREFGRLRVVARHPEKRGHHAQWDCLCDPRLGGCGRRVIVPTWHLTSSPRPTRSCGCLRAEKVAARNRERMNTPAGEAQLAATRRRDYPRTCRACGDEYRGYPSQRYCAACRALAAKPRAVRLIRRLMARHGITPAEITHEDTTDAD